ncbi:MAG: hypothetical protein KBG07_00365 [Elusimicrobia bacterium]|nr:hypothetical protein [Elusimicrobiota bacterium]
MRHRAWALILAGLLASACAVSAEEAPSLKKSPRSKKPATSAKTSTSAPDKAPAPAVVREPQKPVVPPPPSKESARKTTTPPPPPPSEPAGGDSLGSLDVTGQAKDKVNIEKVTPEIKVDMKELVDSVTDKTEKLLDQTRTIPSDEDFRRFDSVQTQQTARPWLPDLVEPPLISFQPSPAENAVVTWRLEVTDDKGDVIHTITGKGNPVNEIVWDGFNRNGDMIRVASAYSFRFITVDELKGTHTTLGKAFTLRHLKYKDKKNLIMEISSSYLFEDERFNTDALPILERVVDVLRDYSAYPFVVEFQTREYDGETVKARQKRVTEKIATELLLAPDSVRFTYAPVKDRGDVVRFVIKLR